MNRPGYLSSRLTEQQLEAILARGSPLLIIAGPGSGKTEVVTWRVAHLIASGQADSAHCLVTTFTNQEIARYEGRHDDLIYIACFILPAGIISEDIHDSHGYADDIWLCAWVADIVRRELDNDDILIENWDSEAPLVPLIADILAQEDDLINDQRHSILRYIGCDQLVHSEV